MSKSVERGQTQKHLQKLVHTKMYNFLKGQRQKLWLPKDEVLYIIIKKEVKRFFSAESGTQYSEQNYRKLLDVVKCEVDRYKQHHDRKKQNQTLDTVSQSTRGQKNGLKSFFGDSSVPSMTSNASQVSRVSQRLRQQYTPERQAQPLVANRSYLESNPYSGPKPEMFKTQSHFNHKMTSIINTNQRKFHKINRDNRAEQLAILRQNKIDLEKQMKQKETTFHDNEETNRNYDKGLIQQAKREVMEDLNAYRKTREMSFETKNVNLNLIESKKRNTLSIFNQNLNCEKQEVHQIQDKLRNEMEQRQKYKARCQDAIKHGLQEAINWRKNKESQDKISNLNFDRTYVDKIYDSEDNTYLDFFYTKKVNHSLNNYQSNIDRNQRYFENYCQTHTIVKNQSDRKEISQMQKKKYAELKRLQEDPIISTRARNSKSVGLKVDNTSLVPLGGSLNPYGKNVVEGKRITGQ